MDDDAAPFVLVVRFTLRPGSEEAFDRLTQETAAEIREREHNTLVYACHAVQGSPRQRIFYELYRNKAAFEQHESQPHVRRFRSERSTMLESTDVDFLTLQDGKTPPGFELDAIIAGIQARIRHLQERGRMLRAILSALGNLDAVRLLVENAGSAEAAQASLMQLLDTGQRPARAVLDLQLGALSPWRRQQIRAEYDRIRNERADLESIVAAPERLRELVGTERGASLARYDERRWARAADDDWPGAAADESGE
jgi:quinol monooxygenase YgiN